MNKSLLFSILFLSVIFVSANSCGYHEISAIVTCPDGARCTRQAIHYCKCEDGYFRGRGGWCIPEDRDAGFNPIVIGEQN